MRFVSRPPIFFIKIWRFDTRRPHHQIGLEYSIPLSYGTAFVGAGDHSLRQHANAQFGQFIKCAALEIRVATQVRQPALNQRHVQRRWP